VLLLAIHQSAHELFETLELCVEKLDAGLLRHSRGDGNMNPRNVLHEEPL